MSSPGKGLLWDACGQQGHGCLLAPVSLKLKQLFAPTTQGMMQETKLGMNHPCGAGIYHISLRAEMRPWGLLFMYALALSSGVIYSVSRGLALNHWKAAGHF